ncbi:DNA repair exonuclease [Cohnella sp. CFH 77786]|uniref:metallophosphoesterase family protein n=1 Tax=Cohnella sp. CFH 77786 TaxID=2662265 RepID=UPI001C61073A|nr:DNA repair exonuclease [Cohnella sp. CFH 77786]MBW5445119.1 DNA repair exonuclease [Cohnella sp. CFH 77786]
MGVPFTFVHAADLHLDSPFKGLAKVPDAVRNRLRESTFGSFRRLVETAICEGADFVVLAGDLYDMADRSLRAQLRLQRMLSELAGEGIGVFVVHGNHDPESGRQARLDWPPGVRVFESGEAGCAEAYRRDGRLAAYVYGISYPTPAVTDNLALRFSKREGAPFHLALLHGNVDGNPGHDNYAPCRLTELVGAGFDYWALGHVHDRRVLHEYPHVVYPGNIQGRSIRETGPKGAYVVRVSEAGEVSLSFRDTAEVLWMETTVSIEGIGREQQLKERLLQAAEEARAGSSGRPVILRLRFAGRGALHETLLEASVADEWLEELREWLGSPEERDDWVWPESIAVHTAGAVDLAALSGEDGFLGELVRRGLRAEADPAVARMLEEEALVALRRLPRIREWLASRSDAERAAVVRRATELAVSMLRNGEAE